MIIGNNEMKQAVEDWNRNHPVGIDVIVTKDDGTEYKTKTHSTAWILNTSRNYHRHTAVIVIGLATSMTSPICYALERVREA